MTHSLSPRTWLPEQVDALVKNYAEQTHHSDSKTIAGRIQELVSRNKDIHERECFNLNPAANVMNPHAEAMLASGLSTRPSLGYPGDKYETGLEATEEIEVIAAELCAEIFNSNFAEIRVASGAMANMYTFMACCEPGDTIIAPPPNIGGHVTHHSEGCAGLYKLNTVYPSVVSADFTVDLDSLQSLADEVKPKLITLGGSLNLFPHPIAEARDIADKYGAALMFDAAHQCGLFAGGSWPNPISEGAHIMTMSTYKSLGGPAGGLIVSNNAALMEKIEAIAFPGMTANFDAAKSAALAISMLDWREHGEAYAQTMVEVAKTLAVALKEKGIDVFTTSRGITESHQFAIRAHQYGGGQAASRRLRKAGFLTCGIGIPDELIPGDLNGIRIGTPDIARFGVQPEHCDQLATYLSQALLTEQPEKLLPNVSEFRKEFDQIHFVYKVDEC